MSISSLAIGCLLSGLILGLFRLGKLVVACLRAVGFVGVVGLPIVIGLPVGLAFSFH